MNPRHLADWLSPARTAVLVIDMQVDFADPAGAMGRFGVDLSTVPPALVAAARLVEAARVAGASVVFVGLFTEPATDSAAWKLRMARQGGDAEADSALCRLGSPGAAFSGPQPAPGELVVHKTRYSGFHETDLSAELRARGVDTLVVAGLTTECCVDCTVRDAFHQDFQVFAATDACAAYDPRPARRDPADPRAQLRDPGDHRRDRGGVAMTFATESAPWAVDEADRAAIAAAIDADEIVALALALGNIPSPAGGEKAAGDFVFDWMAREGFAPRRVGATPERSNVIGQFGGRGGGRNLLFTAHLDTESPTWDPDLDAYKFGPETLANPEWERCWARRRAAVRLSDRERPRPDDLLPDRRQGAEDRRLRARRARVPDRLPGRDRPRADRGAPRRRLPRQGHRRPPTCSTTAAWRPTM